MSSPMNEDPRMEVEQAMEGDPLLEKRRIYYYPNNSDETLRAFIPQSANLPGGWFCSQGKLAPNELLSRKSPTKKSQCWQH